jgi:RNA polymerase sigma-70 factor, ECF subfamily
VSDDGNKMQEALKAGSDAPSARRDADAPSHMRLVSDQDAPAEAGDQQVAEQETTDAVPTPDERTLQRRYGPREPADLSPAMTIALFEQAVATHSKRLLAIARAIVGNRASPEDVVQQALTNLYQHRARYDWREPGGLLKRAVVNEALRLLRPPKMAAVTDEHAGSTETPVQGMIENETVTQVRAAIAKLPDHFRAALVLCEYENLSYVEIASALGASVPQVKTWLHRARRQLARMLEKYAVPQG